MKNHLATLLNFLFRGLVTSQHGEMIPKIVDDNFSFSRGRKGEDRDLFEGERCGSFIDEIILGFLGAAKTVSCFNASLAFRLGPLC